MCNNWRYRLTARWSVRPYQVTLRAAAPRRSCWKTAEFATLRLRLIKLAARVVERAARIRVWLPTACPDAAIF